MGKCQRECFEIERKKVAWHHYDMKSSFIPHPPVRTTPCAWTVTTEKKGRLQPPQEKRQAYLGLSGNIGTDIFVRKSASVPSRNRTNGMTSVPHNRYRNPIVDLWNRDMRYEVIFSRCSVDSASYRYSTKFYHQLSSLRRCIYMANMFSQSPGPTGLILVLINQGPNFHSIKISLKTLMVTKIIFRK